jgi:ferredoxin
MTYVITTTCIDVKDGSCVDVCPVDCIYEGGRMFYIQPDECINCGICETICPVEAIYREDALPAGLHEYLDINKQFFNDHVSALGSPQGAANVAAAEVDHPQVAAYVVPADK